MYSEAWDFQGGYGLEYEYERVIMHQIGLRPAWEMSWVTVPLSTNENDAVLHSVILGLYWGLLVYDLGSALDVIVYQSFIWAEGHCSRSWSFHLPYIIIWVFSSMGSSEYTEIVVIHLVSMNAFWI